MSFISFFYYANREFLLSFLKYLKLDFWTSDLKYFLLLGCIESLRNLLSDEDSTVRHKATEVLHIAASHNIGRNALQEFNVIIPLSGVSFATCGNVAWTVNIAWNHFQPLYFLSDC